MKVYRYTTNGDGVWSAGKRLLPDYLVKEANKNRKWLKKPSLPDGKYTFYLTKAGKKKYEQTLLLTHKKYLYDIKVESMHLPNDADVVYSDEFQVVIKQSL